MENWLIFKQLFLTQFVLQLVLCSQKVNNFHREHSLLHSRFWAIFIGLNFQ